MAIYSTVSFPIKKMVIFHTFCKRLPEGTQMAFCSQSQRSSEIFSRQILGVRLCCTAQLSPGYSSGIRVSTKQCETIYE